MKFPACQMGVFGGLTANHLQTSNHFTLTPRPGITAKLFTFFRGNFVQPSLGQICYSQWESILSDRASFPWRVVLRDWQHTSDTSRYASWMDLLLIHAPNHSDGWTNAQGCALGYLPFSTFWVTWIERKDNKMQALTAKLIIHRTKRSGNKN